MYVVLGYVFGLVLQWTRLCLFPLMNSFRMCRLLIFQSDSGRRRQFTTLFMSYTQYYHFTSIAIPHSRCS